MSYSNYNSYLANRTICCCSSSVGAIGAQYAQGTIGTIGATGATGAQGPTGMFGGILKADIIPDADLTYNLGSSTKKFKAIWADEGWFGTDTINIGGMAISSINGNTLMQRGS